MILLNTSDSAVETACASTSRKGLTRDKVQKIMSKMSKQLESRSLSLTDNVDLLIKGRIEVVVPCFLVATPWGSWGKFQQIPWASSPKTGIKVAIGKDRCLLQVPNEDSPWVYWSKKHPPADGEFLLVFALTERFAEVFLVTPRIPDVLHFLQPTETGSRLFALCRELIALYSPQTLTALSEFLKVVKGNA